VNHSELLAATLFLDKQVAHLLVTEAQVASSILALVAEIHASFVMDRRLQHELIVVQSLLVLKRHREALARLSQAVADTVPRS
jgi:glycerol-3-phosphate acyltransferase PlsY